MNGIDMSEYPDIAELLSKPRPSVEDALEKFSIADVRGLYDLSSHVGENLPELPDALIADIMREGGVMTITAASKAGKSMLTYELSIALALGSEWLGHRCKPSKVLYCDFENDYREGLNRFDRILKYRHIDSNRLKGLIQTYYPEGTFIYDYETILPTIANIARHSGSNVIVLDSVYNLLGNLDENSAGDISKLFAAIKKLADETGCSLVLVHHFSKGMQSFKSSMDRGSGSGVFGRAPSAILSISELEMTDELLGELESAYDADLTDAIPFKIEATLRSFKRPSPTYGLYCYPVHLLDYNSILSRARPADAARAENARRTKTAKTSLTERIRGSYEKFVSMPSFCDSDGWVSISLIANDLDLQDGYIKAHSSEAGLERRGERIRPKRPRKNNNNTLI